MNRVAVLIPFKDAGVKSRLSGLLGLPERNQFALAMLKDVLRVLGSAGLGSSCFLVTADESAKKVASGAGAQVISESRSEGVNAAVRLAVDRLGPRTEYMVIPSDLPLLRTKEVHELLALRRGGLDLVVTPSRTFDGTNALLFAGSNMTFLSYDDNSFWNHVGGAAGLGLSLGVYSGDGVRFDVDTEDDFRALAGSRTRRNSAQLARSILA